MSLTSTDKDYFAEIIDGAITKAVSSSRDTLDEHWDKKAQNLGDATTGEDLSTTKGKANVRKAYDYITGQMEKSSLVTKTTIVEIVKLAVVALIIILGMKA